MVDPHIEQLCALLQSALVGDPTDGVTSLQASTDPSMRRAAELVANLYARLERLRAECLEVRKDLSDTASFLDSIVENIPDMVFVKDARDLRFVKLNRAAEELMGFRREDLLGRTDLDVFPEEQARFFQAKDREVLAERNLVDVPQEPLSTPHHGTRILHTRKVPIIDADGEPRYLLGISTDVTERLATESALRTAQQIETELRAEKELNQRILECLPGGVVHVGPDGAILTANESALAILGMRFDTLTGRYVADFDGETVFEDGSPCRVPDYPVSGALATGTAQGPVTLGVRNQDGTISWAVYAAVPTFDGDQVSGAVVTLLDITDRKKAEEERHRIEVGLLQAQKLESLGLLSGGIAHDFNNLLVAIIGNAGLALLDLPEASPVRETIGQIDTAARRAADLTRQLLAYSGRGQLQTEIVDLNELVVEMAGLLEFSIPKHVEFVRSTSGVLPPVEADPAQLRQVIMNLITNAAESVDARVGGRVQVRTRMRKLDHSFLTEARAATQLQPGSFVCCEVVDDGVGMAVEVRARMFDPFFTTKRTGRGLGLAAVLGIVRRHGGAIHVEPLNQGGTCITVALPASAGPRPAVERPVEADNEGARTGVLLVVDDDPAVRDIARKTLTRLGYTVLCAQDGLEGLEVFDASDQPVAGVLLDLTMPRLDGARTLHELRKRAPLLPVLLTSGFSEQDAARNLGADCVAGFLPKPWGPRELAAAIENLLG